MITFSPPARPTKRIKSPVSVSPASAVEAISHSAFAAFRVPPFSAYQRASRAPAGVPSSSHATVSSCNRGSDPPEKGVSRLSLHPQGIQQCRRSLKLAVLLRPLRPDPGFSLQSARHFWPSSRAEPQQTHRHHIAPVCLPHGNKSAEPRPTCTARDCPRHDRSCH